MSSRKKSGKAAGSAARSKRLGNRRRISIEVGGVNPAVLSQLNSRFPKSSIEVLGTAPLSRRKGSMRPSLGSADAQGSGPKVLIAMVSPSYPELD
jgi:hypothetical protein